METPSEDRDGTGLLLCGRQSKLSIPKSKGVTRACQGLLTICTAPFGFIDPARLLLTADVAPLRCPPIIRRGVAVMSKAWRALAILSAALFLSGCGTFANVSVGAREGWKNAKIYGGVRRDALSADNWVRHSWTWGKDFDFQQDLGTVVGLGLIGLDAPLSLIGDTLTLPVTVPAAIWGGNAKDSNAGRSNPATAPTPLASPTVAPPAVAPPAAPPPPAPPQTAR